jgi:chemotaxis protein methyltransferase CheR
MKTDIVNAVQEQVPADLMMKISDRDFQAIRDLVYDKFGINLTPEKKGMVVGRLQKILKTKGFQNFHEYYLHLVEDKTDRAINELANQITTNHTFFYREADHFDFFVKTILPEITARKKKTNSHDLRIWCAAASSGEEPYTIVMMMMEYFGQDYPHWDAGLLATDISEKALNLAKQGVYEDYRVKPLPKHLIDKYFKRQQENWVLSERIKKEVTVRRFNLMNKMLPFKKPFDCIWCRNVMIYFDHSTKLELVNKFYNQTVPGGYLLIGHSETIGRGESKWKYVKPAVYRKEE